MLSRLRKSIGSHAINGFFQGISLGFKAHPLARPHKHDVEVLRDYRYAPGGGKAHLLDVYRPTERKGPFPVVLYVHGGAFRILSKDTHWIMGLVFAKMGYLVFNISYRLAPQHRFPAAIADCAEAFGWVCDHAERFGGDLDRLVLAGESAGANLALSLALMTSYRRREPWARRVFDRAVVPRAALPMCGVLQASDPERFLRRKPSLGPFIQDRLSEVTHGYLGRDPSRYGQLLDLADPLCWLERRETPARPLTPCFAGVGTADPLLDDTRRLKAALDAHETPCEVRYYPGEVHAFHALVFRREARRCWRDSLAFLDQHVGSTTSQDHESPASARGDRGARL